MTYNRYIPGADGRYEHRRVVPCPPSGQQPEQPQPTCEAENAAAVCLPKPQFRLPEAGDLLVLLVLLLVLTDGEEADSLTTLVTLAAFLFLR